MGKFQDFIVSKSKNEPKGRKVSLMIAPLVGLTACVLMIATSLNIIAGLVATLSFAIYWATEPGAAAGYTGSVFGKKNMGFRHSVVNEYRSFFRKLSWREHIRSDRCVQLHHNFCDGFFLISALTAWTLTEEYLGDKSLDLPKE